ncbi:MAG: hypothetical protein AAGI15_16340 [Pseudomonadota bacterium]
MNALPIGYRRISTIISALLLSACTNHCGRFIYCDLPKGWPVQNTFTVYAGSADLCIGGARSADCASRGMFQAGTQFIAIHSGQEDGLIATLEVNGRPGQRFTASCFQYNGGKILGLTEVRIGAEIRDAAGVVIASYPAHPVSQRSAGILGC